MEAINVKANNGYVLCPFCGRYHKHGINGGNGYRVPDCNKSEEDFKKSVIVNGVEYFQSSGYHVTFI